MTRAAQRATSVFMALLAALSGLYYQAEHQESIAAAPERQFLRRIIRLDAEISRDLLLIRSGLLLNYDSVNTGIAAMHAQLAALRALPGGAAEEEVIEPLAQVIAQSEEYIETYKSDIAVMRNSLLYVTLLAKRRFMESTSSKSAVLYRWLAPLDNALLRYLYHPSDPEWQSAQAVLRELKTRPWPAARRAQADELIMHGSVVLERAARIDAILRILRTESISEHARRADQAYLERAQRAAEQAHRYWIAIFGVALLLAALLAAGALRLRFTTRELRRSRNQLSALFESAPDAILTADAKQRILTINPAAEALFGYKAHEAVGKPLEVLIPQRFRAVHQEHVHAFASESVESRRLGAGRCVVGLRKDGTEVPLEAAIAKVQAGGPAVLIAMARDIGERQRMETALLASEVRFRATFEQAAVGMALVAPDGRWLRVNNKLCSIVGYRREELLAHTFQSITYPDDLQSDLAQMQQMLDGNIAHYSMEKRYIRRDGSPVWINLTVALVRTSTGEPDYFIAVIEDIDARKRIEQEREQLAALVESSSEFIGTATMQGQGVYLNAAGYKLVGLDASTVTDKNIGDFLPPSALEHAEKTVIPAIFRDGFWSGETELRHVVTGEAIPVQQYAFIIKDPRSGAPMLLANISHDIRERKQAEALIQKLNADLEQRVRERTAQLEEANKQLEMFAYSASHDLRTPLRAIDGFSQALLAECGPAFSPAGHGYLERVRAATQRMGQLIDDLLQFSRLTRVEIASGNVSLSQLAHAALEQLAQLEPARQVDIHIAEHLAARGDPRLLAIVLNNLLSNAWKYTSKIQAARIEFAAGQQDGRTVFYVRDNGVGFDMKYAGKLFGVFQRLHRVEEFPGTGVGLATVANIINRHGGRVWADSAPDQGATFYFTLPQ
ncbi:MAG: PAS domain S-box protein [Gammaproteobacteria bacterium]|nr:PAS domain S-box protein [Gammaproteobacteria bacterium]